MNQVNYANILRHAADSLQREGRLNQASILHDAALAFEQMQAEIQSLQISLDVAVDYLGSMVEENPRSWTAQDAAEWLAAMKDATE